MKAFGLAWVSVLLLCTNGLGREPTIGDSVMVISDHAEVKSKEGTLAIVPMGTQFLVKQKSGAWLLGLFQIKGRNVFGWVAQASLRLVEREITQQPTYEFSWHNLLLARDKVDDTFSLEDHVDGYMQSTREQVWEQCRNDEFQLEKKRIETLAILKKRLAEFDIERDFMLKTKLTFDSYDFKGATFPIKEATGSNYWYENNPGYSDSLPSRLEVYIKDPQLISGIPMGPEAAERFVSSRKSSYGSINRSVYANIRLRITGVRSSGDLESEVRWAQIFSDNSRTRLLYETPKSPLQVEAPAVSVLPTQSPGTQANVQPLVAKSMPATLPGKTLPIAQPSVAQAALSSVPPSAVVSSQATALPLALPVAEPTTFPTVQGRALPLVGQPFQQRQS